MFHLTHHITIGRYRLRMLDKVEVTRSVQNLADTATITLPAAILNHPLDITDRIHEGDPVAITLGYDNRNRQEFQGYVEDIHAGTEGIEIRCLDPLYLFKKTTLEDKTMQKPKLESILKTVCQQVSPHIAVNCDYDIGYGSFVIQKATAYDVLSKIHDEIKADIYFHDGTLHLHPPYSNINKATARLDFTRNVETSDLRYLRANDQDIEVEVTVKFSDGREDEKKTFGTTGGKKISVAALSEDLDEAQTLAEREHAAHCYEGYDGSLTTWLQPYVEPDMAVTIHDPIHPERDGKYYVVAVQTTFDKNGGKRKITLGRRVA